MLLEGLRLGLWELCHLGNHSSHKQSLSALAISCMFWNLKCGPVFIYHVLLLLTVKILMASCLCVFNENMTFVNLVVCIRTAVLVYIKEL